MKKFLRWLPLLLLAYFTAEICLYRLSGRLPTQVSWPCVYALVLANLAWIFFGVRRLVAR